MSALRSALPWMAQRVTRGIRFTADGMVALVADADQMIEHPERRDDLGRCRQKRDDAHEAVVAGQHAASHRRPFAVATPARYASDGGRDGRAERACWSPPMPPAGSSPPRPGSTRSGRTPEALVVAASWEACDDLVRGTLGAAGARFGIVRTTLGRLATQLAAPGLAAEGRAPVTDLGLLAVAASAVHRLHAESALAYFGPVADRPGFTPALARTLEELAMNRVPAEKLRKLPHGGPDLAQLARRSLRSWRGTALPIEPRSSPRPSPR